TAALEGVVRRRGTGEALAGVSLTLSGPGLPAPLVATTDAQGQFRFADVPPGEVTVTLAGERVSPVEAVEVLEAGKQHDLVYEVSLVEPEPEPEDGDDLEIVVVAPPLRREVVSTTVRADEASRVPGTSGDVLRVV